MNTVSQTANHNSDGRAGTQAIEGRALAIGGVALLLMAGNLGTSLLGFVRQAVMTHAFGSNGRTDAFVAASIVPQMFYDLTLGAAVSAALIPTFTEVLESKGAGALWRTVGSVVAIGWSALLGVTILLEVAAGPLMTLILAGTRHNPAVRLEVAVDLVRILLPSLFFLGTSAMLLATLYSFRRFTAPAFASMFYHLGVIGGAVILAAPFGIRALSIGALAGSAGQVAFQLPSLLRLRPSLRIWFEFSPEVRRILLLYLPVAAGLVISIVGQVIDLRFKAQLRSSSITDMQLATTLTQFPIGIAVAAMSYAILPSISSDAAFQRMDQFKDTLAAGIRFVLFLTLPAAVGYLALGTPIVRLLFQHGNFHGSDTHYTALALAGYAAQIPFVGLDQLLIFSFYARKNTVTPMVVGVAGVAIYVVCALLLKPRLGILGLSLSNSIQNSMHALILLAILFSGIGSLGDRGILASVGRSALAAVAMASVVAGVALLLIASAGTTTIVPRLLEVAIPICLGAGCYLAVAALLQSRELALIWSLRSKFTR